VKNGFGGKVCFVTGGAAGIGRAICQQLASAGAIVVVTDVDGSGANATLEDVKARSPESVAIQLDVTDAAAVESAVNQAAQKFGRLDFMFNVAGALIVSELRDLTLADWQRIFNVNFWGLLNGVNASYTVMRKQGHGHIVNMASGLGRMPGPLLGAYTASKHAVFGLSETLRIEAHDFGIRVSTIGPGWVATPMTDVKTALTKQMSAEHFLSAIPVKFISADAAARAALEGVAQQRPLILYPFYVRVLAFLYTMFPDLAFAMNRKALRDLRRDRLDAPARPSPKKTPRIAS
jgi:NAD(P)-dependent dehydrogenase (short-subunit alcohol dehydrogenase family)